MTRNELRRALCDLNAGYWGEYKVEEVVPCDRLIVLCHPVSGRITEIPFPDGLRWRSDLNRFDLAH